MSAIPSPANIGQPVTLTATVTDTTAGHTATIPTGGVTFTDTVGSTVISLNGGAAVTLNGAGVAILSGVTLSGAGAHTITANYAGVLNTFLTSSHTTPLTVTTDTPTVTGPVTQPVQVASGQAGSVLVTVTGPYSVVAVPSGSLSYSVVNSLSVSVASGTAPLTAASTNSTATVPLANSLAPGNYTVSVTYGGDSNYAAVPAVTIPVVVSLITPVVELDRTVGCNYLRRRSGRNSGRLRGQRINPVAGSFAYTATLLGGSPVVVTGATRSGRRQLHAHRHIHAHRPGHLRIGERQRGSQRGQGDAGRGASLLRQSSNGGDHCHLHRNGHHAGRHSQRVRRFL